MTTLFSLYLTHFHITHSVIGKCRRRMAAQESIKGDDVVDGTNRDAEVDQSENIMLDGLEKKIINGVHLAEEVHSTILEQNKEAEGQSIV